MSRNVWKKFTNGYKIEAVATDKKQMNIRKCADKNTKDCTESLS